MFLKDLRLFNFRNFSALNLSLDQRPVILVGNNAVGKSNLMEAIYFLSTTKSQRVEVDAELIRQGESVSRVQGVVDSEEEEEYLEITMQLLDEQFSKRVRVNGVPRRVIDFIGNLPAILFWPQDINMVTGPPSLRRWHLDLALAQVDISYKKALTSYEQFLTARNRILKRIRERRGRIDELTYWTDMLVEYGEAVSDKRKEFFKFINDITTPLGNFNFKYLPSEISPQRLADYNGREIEAAQTLVGPHRDDFDIVILSERSESKDLLRMREKTGRDPSSTTSPQDDSGRNLRRFGSRGEHRTATLAFKLAQLEYMAKILGKRPILLLDDIFSELDSEHRAHVVEVVGKQQTIIATVELENIPKEFLNQARILKVEDGKITNLSS